jgi:hypothetical protein
VSKSRSRWAGHVAGLGEGRAEDMVYTSKKKYNFKDLGVDVSEIHVLQII